jgi:esterase/lipase superfamily enzyme
MLLASIRKSFTSPTSFSDALRFREVPQPKLEPFTTLSEAQFRQRVAGKRCLVLVHGYRNSAGDAVDAYGKVMQMLAASGLPAALAYEETVGFLWPGGLTRVGFPLSVLKADSSAKSFEELLLLLAAAGATVDTQTHSLGARVTLKALDRGNANLRNLHLTAPAVDDESIEDGEVFDQACLRCQRVYALHSKRDSVLKVAYRIGDLWDFDRALGWKGPQHPKKILSNTKVADCQEVVKEHGGYRHAAEYFDYWRQELENPAAPQFVRLKKKS